MSQSEIWVCNVAVATIWTNPDSPREQDTPGLKHPVEIDQWYSQLTTEQRKDLCYQNLVQSQLLYGEELIIDEMDGEWAKIIATHQPSKKDPRGYPGWVPLKQLTKVNQQQWKEHSIALITSKKSPLMNEKLEPTMELSFLTYLPMIEKTDKLIKVLTPQGQGWLNYKDVKIFSSIEQVPKQDGKAIVKAAERFLELPYFWGGMSAFGYDCSGFTYNMHKANGYLIPRDASDQANDGNNIPFDQLQVGDLLFFAKDNGKGRVDHVGIYYGEEQMIHSSINSKGIEIIKIPGSKYEKMLCRARRYISK